MSGFPYLTVPDIPRQLIIEQLNLIDVINLSLASKRSKESIQNLKLGVKLGWKLDEDSAEHNIDLEFRSGKKQSLYIRILDFDQWNSTLFHHLSILPGALPKSFFPPNRSGCYGDPMEFEGVPLFTSTFEHETSVAMKYTDKEKSMRLLINVSNHLLKLFQAYEHFYACESDCSIVPEFLLECQGTFKWCYFNGEDNLSSEIAEFFMDRLEVKEFYIYRDFDFKYQKPLKHTEVILNSTNWLSIDNLIDMKCVSLCVLGKSNVNAQDLITFINHWINGGNAEFERMKLKMNGKELNALDQMPWMENSNLRHHGNVDFHYGRDIRRASDKRLATLVIDWGYVFFLVWTEKYMNPKENEGFGDLFANQDYYYNNYDSDNSEEI